MTTETLTTDAAARLVLPASFASSTVTVEQISDTELRVRKALPAGDPEFAEETVRRLSDRDRDLFLSLLDNPPPPNDALRTAAARAAARRG